MNLRSIIIDMLLLYHIKVPYANPYGFAYFGAKETCWYYRSIITCTLYIYFCLYSGEVIINTKSYLYIHYDDQYWWIIVIYDTKWYTNMSIWAFILVLADMIIYFYQTILIVSDLWWDKANKFLPVPGPLWSPTLHKYMFCLVALQFYCVIYFLGNKWHQAKNLAVLFIQIQTPCWSTSLSKQSKLLIWLPKILIRRLNLKLEIFMD